MKVNPLTADAGAPPAGPASSCATRSSTPPPSCCWTTGHAKEVSIRSVAQRVGVTPPSIYLHFADKDALLDAVCARYFEKLDEEMQRAALDQPTILDVLRAQGLAYVRFATQTPELYRIATMRDGTQGSDVDTTLATSAFVHMRDSVQALMDEGIYPPGDPTALALELWSAGAWCRFTADRQALPAVRRYRGVRRPGVDRGVHGTHRRRYRRTGRDAGADSGLVVRSKGSPIVNSTTGQSVQPVLRPGVDRDVRA